MSGKEKEGMSRSLFPRFCVVFTEQHAVLPVLTYSGPYDRYRYVSSFFLDENLCHVFRKCIRVGVISHQPGGMKKHTNYVSVTKKLSNQIVIN